MRNAGRVVAAVLQRLTEATRPGITTAELERVAAAEFERHHSEPSFLGYRGYPALICTSINDEIVHGIPGPRVLQEGDIVSFDVGVKLDGFQGDAATTVGVGAIGDEAQRLLRATRGALLAGIAAATDGARLGDVSAAVQGFAEAHGFAVVREYVGHGIGRDMHEEPQIPNFGEPGTGPRLRRGMTMAIEPMVNAGTWRTRLADDRWTVHTADGRLSAHFEHTIAVTKGQAEILTQL